DPGPCDHPGAVARANLRLVGVDQDIERRRIDVVLLGQQGFERPDAPVHVAQVAVRGVLIVVFHARMVIYTRSVRYASRGTQWQQQSPHSFLVTIVIMGLSTVLVGVLPTYAQVGVWAPALLVLLRLLQGLAVGGEYGGAVTYVAEHAPPQRRGYATSWLQTTATVGFLLSLVVILVCRLAQ